MKQHQHTIAGTPIPSSHRFVEVQPGKWKDLNGEIQQVMSKEDVQFAEELLYADKMHTVWKRSIIAACVLAVFAGALSQNVFALEPYTASPEEICGGLPDYDRDPAWYDKLNGGALDLVERLWYSMKPVDGKAQILAVIRATDDCTYNAGGRWKQAFSCSKGQVVARWDHDMADSRFGAFINVVGECMTGDKNLVRESVAKTLSAMMPDGSGGYTVARPKPLQTAPEVGTLWVPVPKGMAETVRNTTYQLNW